ncbi:MAG: hypothetical protein QOG68_1110, partial [Solirubrobacteraceae bacterium]|nr:hypothetical protein [Solirubrobacteraceae bacterium]
MAVHVLAALNLTKEIEKYGAYAGLAAILGLAVLSMLYFAQAREVKRLREWAGRAPERDAELQQRVTEEAARRTAGGTAAPATAAAAAAASRTASPATAAGQAGAAKPVPGAAAAGAVKPMPSA